MAPRDTDTDKVARKKLRVKPREEWKLTQDAEDFVEPMTFRPTIEEFKNLTKYVSYMESCGAHLAGIAKIVPPPEWEPNGGPKEDWYNPANMEFTIEGPIQQTIKPTTTHGAFESTSKKLAEMTIPQFVTLATDSRHVTPPHQSYEELEKLYWSYDNIDSSDDPVYGADVPQTLTRSDMEIWNISRLESILTEDLDHDLVGVNTPYLYFGMWKATFSWHVEDLDLHGVNYIHYGAPKTWYCVPPKHGYKVEEAANQLFPGFKQHCFNFLRHKVCMMSPKLLRSRGIKVHKITHEQGEMVVVFPHAYHSGFNHGFNIAEAANFATPSWVEYGKRCRPCTCLMGKLGTAVDFDALEFGDFVKKYQPERLELYETGKDIGPHPEDPQYIKEAYQFCLKVLNEDADKSKDEDDKEDETLKATPSVTKEKDSVENGKEEKTGEEKKNDEEEKNEKNEEEEMTEEQKKRKLRANCKKLLKHMKLYRDLPKELYQNENAAAIEEITVNEDSATETPEEEDKGMTIFQKRKAKKCDVKVQPDKSELMMRLIANLPIVSDSPKKGRKKQPLEAKKRIGFAGISEEELEAKKSKMTCRKKHRLMSCGKCIGCRSEDCGKCAYCKDKPKFGGKNIQKQKCIHKVCKNPEVRTCEDCRWNL